MRISTSLKPAHDLIVFCLSKEINLIKENDFKSSNNTKATLKNKKI